MKVRTLILALIVLAAIVLGFTLLRGHTITNYPTSGTTIVAFGDSLVVGEGTTPGNNFVLLLSKRVGEPIVNLGVSGNTTADGLARLDEVLAEDPRIVILLLGGNDALRRVPVADTFANLSTIIETIQAEGAGVLLVGVTGGLYGAQYEDEFEKLAERHGVAYVRNILSGLIARPEYMADAIHPNDAGHVLMADAIEPQLRLLLEGKE